MSAVKLFIIILFFFEKYGSVKTQINLKNSYSNQSEFEYTNQFAKKYLWPTVPIVFLLLGTLLNILSILVFIRREMIKFSSFCYFAVLNIVNIAYLFVTMSRSISEYNFDSDIRLLSLFGCKTHVFLTYFLSHLSSLILCAISIDRTISVMFLRKAKELCTPTVAFRVTIGLILYNILQSGHFLVFDSGHEEIEIFNATIEKTFILCQTRNNTSYNAFVEHAWKLIDMTM